MILFSTPSMHFLLALPLALTSMPTSDATSEAARLASSMRGEPVALLPRGVTSFGAEAVGGWIYVFGGYHGEPHRYAKEGQSDDFLRMNMHDPRQFELLDGDIAIQGAQLAAWRGSLVCVGGMVARNVQGESPDLHSVADVAIYDTRARTWNAMPSLPHARSSHDVEVFGDRLVVLGGWTLDGGARKTFRGDALVLDLAHPKAGWTSIDAPFRRRALSAARIGTGVAAIGGIDADGDVQPTVDLLDLASGAWTRGPDFPGSPFGVAACAVDDGVLASGKDGVVWKLDANASAWSRAGNLAFPRFFHQMVAGDRGDVFVLGGIDDMRKDGRVRHVERLAAKRGSGAIVSAFEIPAPFLAKNRQGAFLRGNVLTLFGGNKSLNQHDFKVDDFQSDANALDLATLAWKPRANFPEGRQTITASMASDGTEGFALGGFGFDDGRARAQAASYRYAFADDTWSRALDLDLPSPRTQFGLAQSAGTMWVFGGLDYDAARGDQAFRHPTTVLRLDRDDAQARFVDAGVAMTSPRRAFACATLDGKAYLVGGMREGFEVVEECEAFDFASRTFAPIAPPRRPRVSAELVVLDGKLYLCGGSSRRDDGKLAPDDSIERFDPATGAWSPVVESLPFPMRHLRAFALRDRLLLVSSHVDGPPATRVVLVAP